MRSFLTGGKSDELEIPIQLKDYDPQFAQPEDPNLYVAHLQNRDLSCCVHFQQFGTSAITSCYGPWKPKFKQSSAIGSSAKVNVAIRVLCLSDSEQIQRIQNLEQKISQILSKVVKGQEYPGCFIDMNLCINTVGSKVRQELKSAIFCTFQQLYFLSFKSWDCAEKNSVRCLRRVNSDCS